MLLYVPARRAALKSSAAFLFALFLALTTSTFTANAACEMDTACGSLKPVPLAPASAPPVLPSLVPYVYAQTTVPSVSVYADPGDESVGIAPIRVYGTGFVWLSLADPTPILVNSQFWYRVNPDGYVHAESLKVFQPSSFQGVALTATPDKPMAWVVYGTRTSTSPGAQPNKNSAPLARYTAVTIQDQKQVGEWTWYKVGDSQWVDQRQLGVVRASTRPASVGPNDKWIDVNLYEQTLAAYEGDRMVYATLISSGLPQWPTPPGLYQVWAKVTDWKMSGRDGLPDYYYLEDVPWILYFNKGVALHAAYWHDKFGAPHSHGCVNLSPQDAKWLFDWATPNPGSSAWTLSTADNPGTWVWVH